MIYFLTILVLLFVLELVYFKIADRFNIIDKPNHRSSHTKVTIRGGGIIFPIAVLAYTLFSGFENIYFVLGLMAIATISFLDDMLTLNNKVRLAIHLSAVLLLFYQWGLFSLTWYGLFVVLIFVIATINAYNFMDGINGITGGYSLLTIATLYYINSYVVAFVSAHFLMAVAAALLVFNFFNFRTKAKCFAGDVGSVSIAFILIFAIGSLIIQTQNIAYVLCLLIYGLDTVTTIIFRLIRKENIFEAHRSHFYQFLSNEKKLSHLTVTGIYMGVQLLLNVLILFYLPHNLGTLALAVLLTGLIFLGIRFTLEGKKRLLANH